MAKIIRIKPIGRLGNRMFQYLLARVLQSFAPDAVIEGGDLPEFGFAGPKIKSDCPATGRPEFAIRGHVFSFDAAVELLRSSPDALIHVEWVCMRMEYFRRYLQLARALFPVDTKLKTGFDGRFLVISIRGGDALSGRHPNYTMLPLAWYRHLLARSELEPVFLGEIGDNVYCDALRMQFPNARFVTSENPLDDFNMLRTSTNVVLSVSSFSWLAAWLSTTAERIVLPIAGVFNPLDRPDVDLLPVHDFRYQFYRFPQEVWTGSDEQLAAKINGSKNFHAVRTPRLFRGWSTVRVSLIGRRPDGLSLTRDLKASLAGASTAT